MTNLFNLKWLASSSLVLWLPSASEIPIISIFVALESFQSDKSPSIVICLFNLLTSTFGPASELVLNEIL